MSTVTTTSPTTDPQGDYPLVMRDVLTLVKDLISPNPWIYWTDFLLSIVSAQAGLWFFTGAQYSWPVRAAGFLCAVVCFYRATVFTHELAHLRAGTFKGFRVAWNALCGIPFLMPSFLYEDHRYHHVNHHYGTLDDSEYLPLGRGTKRDIAKYVLQLFFVPLFGIVRFVVLTPFTWFSSSFRDWVWQRSSAMTAINWNYRRPLPEDQAEWRQARIMETLCFLYGSTFVTLVLTGILPWQILPQMYAVFASVTALNYMRTLGAHRYLSDGEPMDYRGQILDSYTIPGHPLLTEVWAPLGMRYHALHHLVPSMPYHNMGRAHRRLVKGLPADSAYHATIRPGLRYAIREVVAHARGLVPTA
ncbi:MAG: fatty acid desaturase [Pirellulales bacterium]